MRRLFFLVLFVFVAAACTIVNGLSVSVPPEEAGVGAADSEAPSDVRDGGADVDPCNHAYAPSAPLPGPATGTIRFISAMSTIDLGVRDGGYEAIGFDLDSTCSCGAVKGTCRSSTSVECDLDGGVDNEATQLFAFAGSLPAGRIDVQDDAQQALNAGAPGVLVWVEGYNGEADDPEVTVAVLIAPGTEDGDRPHFTPGEVWATSNTETYSLADGGTPFPISFLPPGSAFVRNHQLVVKGRLRLPLLVGLTLQVEQAILVADIEQIDATTFGLTKGVIGGRVAAEEVIRAIGGVEYPPKTGVHLCEADPDHAGQNETYFAAAKGFVCADRDVMTSPSQDGTGVGCNGLSLGIRFSAVRAAVGSIRDPIAVTYCADADISCPDAGN